MALCLRAMTFSSCPTSFSNCRIPNLFPQSLVLWLESWYCFVLFLFVCFPSRKTRGSGARRNSLPIGWTWFQNCILMKFFPLEYRPLSLLRSCLYFTIAAFPLLQYHEEIFLKYSLWESAGILKGKKFTNNCGPHKIGHPPTPRLKPPAVFHSHIVPFIE